jgi:hypothetical protein
MKITLKQFKALSPCEEAYTWVRSQKTRDLQTLWETCQRSDWMLWILRELNFSDDRIWRLMAVAFVRETPLSDGRKVFDLLTDERSKQALDVAEQYAQGKAGDNTLSAARAAARDAAGAAARDAAWAAARVAAWDAAGAAARDAARAAARVAAWDAAGAAARDAAWAAARVAAWDAAGAAARDAARAAARVAAWDAAGAAARDAARVAQSIIVRRFVSWQDVESLIQKTRMTA